MKVFRAQKGLVMIRPRNIKSFDNDRMMIRRSFDDDSTMIRHSSDDDPTLIRRSLIFSWAKEKMRLNSDQTRDLAVVNF